MIFLMLQNVPIVESTLRGDIMELMIKKRTGELVPFDKKKIEIALKKAHKEVYPNEVTIPSYFKEIADDEGRTYEAIKKRMERIRAEIREEILECLEMNCRGGE